MRIDRIELFHVAMPLKQPWRTAYGEDATVHSVLCRMTSGSIDAWGESTPLAAPCYSPEWGGGLFAVCRDWLAPAVIGQNLPTAAHLQERLALFKGNPFAKAVLDSAWWNLHSRVSGKSLHIALGATRDEAVVGADFGVLDDIDELLNDVGRAVDDGFPRIKLKFRPGWGIPMLTAVRRQHPDHTFHIDCNSGYQLSDLPLFRQIDEFQLAMIEQPLAHDDLNDHAALTREIDTPICLDESIASPRHAQQAIDLESCGIVNVKPGRVGGLTNALAIHNICQQAGIPCWVGGMLESALGASMCIALTMLDQFTYPGDLFPSSRFYHEDLCDPPIQLHRNPEGLPAVRAFDRLPEPIPARLESLQIQRALIEP